MKVIKIDKKDWAKGIKALHKAYGLIGPVKEKEYFTFQVLSGGTIPDLEFRNTRLSPKAVVFPQSEDMFEYSLDDSREDHHLLKEVEKDYSPRVVFGIRPCDAKALELVKMNFDTDEYKDPYWLNLYEATTFVGMACDSPCSTCFCTTAGTGPYHEEGLDVLMADNGDSYLAKLLTDKGEKLATSAGWADSAGKSDVLAAKKTAAEAKIVSTVSTEALSGKDALELYNADFWEDVSFACINCGTCTYVCPTCWCFDIQDEVHGKSGKRMRTWDSCMFPIFTVHTTGHNPRATKLQRVRQRFMHKLKYFVDKYDKGIMCVGCGRCVRQCPVNIDIRRVCETMNSFGSDNTCAVQSS
ncbi:MAG: 4Fe-4S dicluster domain-containing protein [Desulfobacteraceae bacterium]|nr:4Fe-4S dicluster domain-containing protein [Desulfobacteraceae bacterium]